jgi:hypothetical protein
MKKSNFTALVLGTVSGVMFSIGMCMTMIPEWNAFQPGIVFGCVGLVLALITLLIWRRMENKAPIHLDSKTILTVIIGIVGVLALGIGMCFSMIWGEMIKGIIIGLIGIAVLFTLIPLTKGIQE